MSQSVTNSIVVRNKIFGENQQNGSGNVRIFGGGSNVETKFMKSGSFGTILCENESTLINALGSQKMI